MISIDTPAAPTRRCFFLLNGEVVQYWVGAPVDNDDGVTMWVKNGAWTALLTEDGNLYICEKDDGSRWMGKGPWQIKRADITVADLPSEGQLQSYDCNEVLFFICENMNLLEPIERSDIIDPEALEPRSDEDDDIPF